MRTFFSGARIYLFSFLLFLTFISCNPQTVITKEPLKEQGEVLLYLEPMPKEAGKFLFTIENIYLISEEGTDVPLPLSPATIEGAAHVGVQQLLASGRISPGSYKGIGIKVEEAQLVTEDGTARLLIPGEPVEMKQRFQIHRGEALALFLEFTPAKSITEGINFTPVFNLMTYGNELVNLAGYITSREENLIHVFNKKTMYMVGAVATGRAPAGIVFDEEQRQAYAALSGDDVIELIDVFTGEITGRMRLHFGDKPLFLSLVPDGDVLLSVNSGSNTVSILDTRARFEVTRLTVGVEPVSAVIDPSGLRAYVMNSMSRSVSVIDLSSRSVFATIPVEGIPLRGDFNRKGDRLYIVNRDVPHLTVIDPSSLTVTEKIFTGTGGLSIKVDTRTGLIYVGNRSGGQISVVSPTSSMFIDTITTGGTVTDMVIDDQENTLLALIPGDNVLKKINLTNKKIMAELDVDEGAYAVAVMDAR